MSSCQLNTYLFCTLISLQAVEIILFYGDFIFDAQIASDWCCFQKYFSHRNDKQKLLSENLLWCQGRLHFLQIIEHRQRWCSVTSGVFRQNNSPLYHIHATPHQIKSHSFAVFSTGVPSPPHIISTSGCKWGEIKRQQKKQSQRCQNFVWKNQGFCSSVTNTNREETNQTNFKQN